MNPYLTAEDLESGSVVLICASCGYPYREPPPTPDDRRCSHPERHAS